MLYCIVYYTDGTSETIFHMLDIIYYDKDFEIIYFDVIKDKTTGYIIPKKDVRKIEIKQERSV